MVNIQPSTLERKHKNECHVHGVLSQDPQLRATKTGKSFCRATIETQYKEYREFIRVCETQENIHGLEVSDSDIPF